MLRRCMFRGRHVPAQRLFSHYGLREPPSWNRRFFALSTSPTRHSADYLSSSISPWYAIVGGFVITFAGGVKYVHDLFDGTEGLQRSVHFYSIALPRYAQYRLHMFRDSPSEVWDELHRETSLDALKTMLHLKGFYIKSGQLCAANIGNAFPKIWQDTLSVLQDQVPPKDFAIVQEIVESEMKKPISEVFSTFERDSIGSASIGQVHRAKLLDGTPVVVKVMYPEVERLFRGDVLTIKLFAQLAQPVHVPGIKEIERQFMNEFDYQREARQMATIRQNLSRAGLAGGKAKLCEVPFPYLDICTKRVLVMEELKGEKLQLALNRDMEHHAIRAGKSIAEFQEEQRKKEKEAQECGESLKGRSARELDLYISILNRKRQAQNILNKLHNFSVGWIPGTALRRIEGKDTLPLNHAKLIDDLFYIHGHEVLVDGYFNGDPHPGNILLLGADEGRPQLGLIDYGQVKRISKETRLNLCRLIIALAEDNHAEIVRLMKVLGYKSQRMDEDCIYLYAKVAYDNEDLIGGQHIQLFMEELQAKDPVENPPLELLVVSRASIMIRGLASALHQGRSMAKEWEPIAKRVLQDEDG